MSDLNVLMGIDFSLIGTRLHAAYEKKGEDVYSVLLVPTPQEAENGISIGGVIKDIQKLIQGTGSQADTEQMEADLTKQLSDVKTGDDSLDLDKIMVKLNMAFLYICKGKEKADDILEYAFQLQILAKDFIPREIAQIVDVTNVSLSVWNTSRKKVVEQMQLTTIDEYVGSVSAVEEKPDSQPEEKPDSQPEEQPES